MLRNGLTKVIAQTRGIKRYQWSRKKLDLDGVQGRVTEKK